jgi:hypothetical protein
MDDLDDEFKLESDDEEEEEAMASEGEEEEEEELKEVEEAKQEDDGEKIEEDEKAEEKANETEGEVARQQNIEEEIVEDVVANASARAESIQPRNLQIALTKIARGEVERAKPTASANEAAERKVLPPTPGNTPVEMAVEDAAKDHDAVIKEQMKTPSNLLLKQRSMLPPTITLPSRKKHRGEGGKENTPSTKPKPAEDLPTTNTHAIVSTTAKKGNTDTPQTTPPKVQLVETNANEDCLEEDKRYAAAAIELTSRLEKLLDEAKDLTNRSTNTALHLTVTSCEFHFAVNPAKMKQIQQYTKQAEEILAREELRKQRVSATTAQE